MIDYENDLQDNSAQEIEDIVGMNQSKDWVKQIDYDEEPN